MHIRNREIFLWFWCLPMSIGILSPLLWLNFAPLIERRSSQAVTDIGENDFLQSSEKSILKGQMLYSNYCSNCHGSHGTGDGPVMERMGLKAASLLEKDRGSYAIPELYLTIRNGKSGTTMSAFYPSLSPEQIWSLIHYLSAPLGLGMRTQNLSAKQLKKLSRDTLYVQ